MVVVVDREVALLGYAYLHVVLVQWWQSVVVWLAEIVHIRLGRLLNLQIYNQKTNIHQQHTVKVVENK